MKAHLAEHASGEVLGQLGNQCVAELRRVGNRTSTDKSCHLGRVGACMNQHIAATSHGTQGSLERGESSVVERRDDGGLEREDT